MKDVQIDLMMAIQNDAQIIALNKALDDLYLYLIPKYVMQTNGKMSIVNQKEINESASKILEQIDLRQQQIASSYNAQFNTFGTLNNK